MKALAVLDLQAMALCERARADGYAPAIIGDLNMGPEASKPNYDFLLHAGYRDAVAPFATSVGCTWDPTLTAPYDPTLTRHAPPTADVAAPSALSTGFFSNFALYAARRA